MVFLIDMDWFDCRSMEERVTVTMDFPNTMNLASI